MSKFQIKKVQLRQTEDLTKYKNEIISGVRAALSNSKLVVDVFSTYFEISSQLNLSQKQAQQIGKEIINRCSHFKNIATTYNYKRSNGKPAKSVQLFEQI